MSSIIVVENLSKKYIIGHQQQEHYSSLRDMLVGSAKKVMSRLVAQPGQEAGDPSHEEFWALKDVSFEIKQGDRVGIIGSNGAGKSTLLKILSRITEPTLGRVKIKGRVASLLEVGTGFHPELTGRENIYLNGAILGMSKAEIKSKFDEIVDFSGVEKFLDTPVKRYSSGMYVRLAFAVAAHLEPEILIVDEVLAVGDAQFQKKCMGKLKSVGQDGRTVLFVSHNMAAIKTLCTNVISLCDGQIVNSGLASVVIDEYLNKGLSNKTKQVWPCDDMAPGNENIRLSSMQVLSENNGADHFTIRTPLRIEFTYRLLLKEAFFYASIHFKTLSGECIFVTTLTPRKISSGAYRSACHIPGDLLNVGTYSMHIYFVRDGNSVLFEMENPLIFEIHDVKRDDGEWMGAYPGAVHPKLLWDFESIAASN